MNPLLQYEVSETTRFGSGRVVPTIIIRRKPSEIPRHLDQVLTRLAGWVEMDGPNSTVIYEFLDPKNIIPAEKYLQEYMWERK